MVVVDVASIVAVVNVAAVVAIVVAAVVVFDCNLSSLIV